MGIEEQIDKLIDLGEDIKSRLDRLIELASDRFADASKIVAEEPAKEASLGGLPDLRTFAQPNLRWRILEPGEVVCSSDWVTAKTNPPSDPPNGLGWRPVDASVGTSVCQDDPCVFARPDADEPAKEPEHPAGPMPDPGEGYRLLSKDPPEDLRDGDELFHSTLGRWCESIHAGWGYKRQDTDCWYRRKIEAPKPPEPAYREPVLPADAGEQCEFSCDGKEWCKFLLAGWQVDNNPWICERYHCWPYARIKKDA